MKPVLAALTILLVYQVSAQDVDPTRSKELDSLEFSYQVAEAEIRRPLKTLTEQYVSRLNTLSSDLQKDGNLRGLLAVKAEIEALESTGMVNPSPDTSEEPKQLVDSRNIYQRTYEKIEPPVTRKSKMLLSNYRTQLGSLQTALTREERLPEALAVRDALAALPTDDGRQTVLKSSLKLKLQIDGMSLLKIRGDEIWYDHQNGRAKAPGLHDGNFPTYIDDDTEWMPVWEDRVTRRHDIGLGLATKEPAPTFNLRNASGRGYADVIEQPSAANNYTATIGLYDEDRNGSRFGGSEWIEFRLDW